VVKIGGGIATIPGALARVAGAIVEVAQTRRLVVFPGGGPFAEQVRAYDRAHGLSATAAHWMAILAMDQYAHALADLIPGARTVEDRAGIESAHADGAVPVLRPSRWLRAADELPHSWDVTSDSLAAYTATLLGAAELVLVKPVSGGTELLDPYFGRAIGAGIRWRVVGVGEVEGWSKE
jgi:dihydroneopterin aldolase